MWKALALKELREAALLAVLALVAYLYATLVLMGAPLLPGSSYGRAEIPFLGSTFYLVYAVVAALFAVALGMRQTLGEALGGTYQFLLTRPAGRTALYAKLAVGTGLYFAISALPILLYAAWAATPGTHASPFAWSMTLPAWMLWLGMSLLYAGAFLSGLRPARWFGTRLLPLAGSVLGTLMIAVEHDVTLVRLLGAVVAALLLAAIGFTIRTRDFT